MDRHAAMHMSAASDNRRLLLVIGCVIVFGALLLATIWSSKEERLDDHRRRRSARKIRNKKPPKREHQRQMDFDAIRSIECDLVYATVSNPPTEGDHVVNKAHVDEVERRLLGEIQRGAASRGQPMALAKSYSGDDVLDLKATLHILRPNSGDHEPLQMRIGKLGPSKGSSEMMVRSSQTIVNLTPQPATITGPFVNPPATQIAVPPAASRILEWEGDGWHVMTVA